MKTKIAMIPQQPVEDLICTIRGQRVILDADLARVYGVPTKRLNEAVRRNVDRFPADFVFPLVRNETEEVRRSRSQIATSSSQPIIGQGFAYPDQAAAA